MTHQRFFNILLVDFLSVTDSHLPTKCRSYLQALQRIVASPNFDVSDSVHWLRTAVNDLVAWLDQETISKRMVLPITIRSPLWKGATDGKNETESEAVANDLARAR